MQTHFLPTRGLLWGSLDCHLVRILGTELPGQRFRDIQNSGPRALDCSSACDCDTGHIYTDAQMTGAPSHFFLQTRMLFPRRVLPHQSAPARFGEASKGASHMPRLPGAPSLSAHPSPLSCVLVSVCLPFTAFLLWTIKYVLVIATVLLIMKVDHLKSDVQANVCASGAPAVPRRPSFIDGISQ